MKRLLLTIALVLTGITGTALADSTQSSSLSSSLSDNDCAKARKAGRACQLVFDGDTVDGERVSGDGDLITAGPGTDFDSLIRVRTSFRDQILKTAETL